MKVLIAFFTQTGNTQRIAKAIHAEVSQSHDADSCKIDEVNPGDLDKYDLIFAGTPIHAGGLAAAAKEFLDHLPDAPGFSLAGFVTHASDVYNRENFEKGILSFGEISRQKNIAYLGCYDCQGRLAPAIQPMVQKARGVSDEEWAQIMAKTDEHPDAGDELKAGKFARETLLKLQQ